jgi:hypothetical protein
MFPPVFQWLKASTDVRNIAGTRIWRHGSAPQTSDGKPMPNPYVTWFIASNEPANNLSDPVPVDKYAVQVDCWHQTDSGIESLAEAVRDALSEHCVMTGVIANLRETETRLYRVGMTFDIWHGRVPAS